MKPQVKAALSILALGLLMVGVAYVVLPMLRKQQQEDNLYSTSDATKATPIRIGGDGYIGYWMMNSPEMRKASLRRGIKVEFTDDGGAYAERLAKFDAGEYEAIVLPINSFLEHGAPYEEGVIVAPIAQSIGADGIAGFKDKFPDGKINELNAANLNGVYIPDSPNSFLLDLAIFNYGLDYLAASGSWRTEVSSPDEVIRKAKRQEGDFFVLWEPELSRALREVQGLQKIFGSDVVRGYITDVFVFRRDFLRSNETEVMKFFETYYQVLQSYSGNSKKLHEDLTRSTGLTREQVQQVLAGVDFFDLFEACSDQFDIPTNPGEQTRDGVVNTIIACMDVLNQTSRRGNPIDADPYLLTNSKILEGLLERAPTRRGVNGQKFEFEALSDSQWSKLHEVGVMRVEPIKFNTGEATLTPEGVQKVETIISTVKNNVNPAFRIEIRGHTSSGSDEEVLEELSLERAKVVKQLLVSRGIDSNRLHCVGLGSSIAPSLKPGESKRSRTYRYRRQRVEFALLYGNNL